MNSIKHLAYLFALVTLVTGVSCTRNGMPKKQSNARSRVEHLLIKEIFYVGHYSERDTRAWGFKSAPQLYDDDQYFTIYNPTDEVKYLDGLAIVSSALDPSEIVEFAPKDNFVNRYYGAASMMCFPGKGQDYPIRPKQEIVVAKYAIDHQAAYLKNLEENNDGEPVNIKEYKGMEAFLDLRKADFEWTNRDYLSDTYKKYNNPEVPDMEAILIGTGKNGQPNPSFTFNYISARGGLALIKLPWTKEDFAQNYQDKKGHRGYYHYISITSSSFADFYAIEIPFSHVIDCVTICPKREYKQRTTKLDRGYTAVTELATSSMPKTEYAKFSGNALVRRWDGRKFVDDDNSTADFEVKVASLSRKDEKGNVIK